MKRWVIRSFFIGLLMLLVGGWVGSYPYKLAISYTASHQWGAACMSGKLHLMRIDNSDHWLRPGWESRVNQDDFAMSFYDPEDFESKAGGADTAFRQLLMTAYPWIGIYIRTSWGHKLLVIPFWLLTVVVAATWWLVSRKTRAKVGGFPVKFEKPNAEQSGKIA